MNIKSKQGVNLPNTRNSLIVQTHIFQPFSLRRKWKQDLHCSRLATISFSAFSQMGDGSFGSQPRGCETFTSPKFAVHFHIPNYHVIYWTLRRFIQSTAVTKNKERMFSLCTKYPKQKRLQCWICCDRVHSKPVSTTRFMAKALPTQSLHQTLTTLRKHRWSNTSERRTC